MPGADSSPDKGQGALTVPWRKEPFGEPWRVAASRTGRCVSASVFFPTFQA